VRVPDFNSPAREAPVIPMTAVRYSGSLPGVCVQGQDGRPELRLIRVGEQVGNGMMTVLSGIQAGDRVLRNPGPGGCSPAR
jgi:hypothetical protein